MQKLRYPVNFIGIKTFYSQSHQAIDLGWHDKEHEEIYACADGKVTNIWQDEDFGGGLSLHIDYDNGFGSDFKHLNETIVKVGDRVVQGQHVAYMGNSGWACYGTHLHLNCYLNGRRVNPLEYIYVYPNQEVSEEDKDCVLYYHEEPQEDLLPIGTRVIANGYLYYTAYDSEPAGRVLNKETIITRREFNSPHPYNTEGDLGWMDKDAVRKVEDNRKSNEEIAKEVIRGDWGNGQERYERLTEAGYNYQEIQDLVNQMLG